jgi:hypothetical protein
MSFIESWWKTILLLVAALVIVLFVSRSLRKAVAVAAGYGIYPASLKSIVDESLRGCGEG